MAPTAAVSAAVKATSRKAGTASRLASGATRETRWKLTAVMGSVKAMAAMVTAASSMAGRVRGKEETAGQRCARAWARMTNSDPRVISPSVAAKLNWKETSWTAWGSMAVMTAPARASAIGPELCRPRAVAMTYRAPMIAARTTDGSPPTSRE